MTALQSEELTPEDKAGVDVARTLISWGVPVFAARPAVDADGEWQPAGGTDGCGYWLPQQWQKTFPTENWLDPQVKGWEDKAWRPGWALSAVMGHRLDLLDVDPRNGGNETRAALERAELWPRAYAEATTPSGGTHTFVASMQVGSRDSVRPGLDVKGGKPDGSSRGFAFIAPTRKLSKATGAVERYRWVQPPDLDGLDEGDDSTEGLADLVRQAKGTTPLSTAPGADPFDLAGGRLHQGPIPDGERHVALVSYAGRLRHSGLRYEEAELLMRERWADCVQPPAARTPLPWPEAQDKLRDVFERYPAGRVLEDCAAEALDAVLSGAAAPGSTWGPVALAGVVESLLNGTTSRLSPTIGVLDGGGALFYRGKVNGIAGASGSGKTWTALAACAQEIDAGEHAVYVDLEDDVEGVTGRLLNLGADCNHLIERFHYIRPDEQFSLAARQHLDRVMTEHTPSLVVIDSTGEAMALDGKKPNEDDDVARWFRQLPTAVARKGPAVVVLDHVIKGDDGGLWPIGSQRKRAAISGAQYMQDVRRGDGFAKGQAGRATLTCAKDRHGSYRPAEKVATLSVEPAGDGVRIGLCRVQAAVAAEPSRWRPTLLMERVSDHLERIGQLQSKSTITSEVTGNKDYLLKALDALIAEGHVTTAPGARRAVLCTLVRPYRQVDDPLSDKYVQPEERVDLFDLSQEPRSRPVPRSSSREEERENGSEPALRPVLGRGEERVRNGWTQDADEHPWTALEEGPCASCSRPTRRYEQ